MSEPRRASWFKRIGLAVAIGVVALIANTFLQVYGDRRTRERTQALLSEAQPYQAEVARARQARGPMPVAQKLPQHSRSMSASDDGTIVIEVADDKLPGARMIL